MACLAREGLFYRPDNVANAVFIDAWRPLRTHILPKRMRRALHYEKGGAHRAPPFLADRLGDGLRGGPRFDRANDKFGIWRARDEVERYAVALAVAVLPRGTDFEPGAFFLAPLLNNRVNTVRRAVTACFGSHILSFQLLSPPQWRPRCPFAGRSDQAGQSQAGRQATQKGVELHKPQARKRTALISNARVGRTGAFREDACLAGCLAPKGR